MIADEQEFPIGPGESEMIGGVSGRRNGFELPAIPLDDIAILDLYIGAKVTVRA